MEIIAGNAQHIGARELQEDSFGFSSFQNEQVMMNRGCLAIVADGMGGMALGREASGTAVQSFLHYYQDLTKEGAIPQLLKDSLLYSNQMVCRLAREKGLDNQLGTTLIAAVIKEEHLYWISVGDSRIYLFRDGKLTQLTQDHVYANHLYEEVAGGSMTIDEVESHPQKDALTSFLGLDELTEVDVNVKPFPLSAGDRILLCSDGLFGFTSEADLTRILIQNEEDACQSLVDHIVAKQHPYQDNITAAILQYGMKMESPATDFVQRDDEEAVKNTVMIRPKKTRRFLFVFSSSYSFYFYNWCRIFRLCLFY